MKSSKIIALALVCLMILPLLFSCAKPKDDVEGSKPESSATTEQPAVSDPESGDTQASETETENVYVMPKENFNKTITVLYWEDVENIEFFPKNNDLSDSVEKAIFARNEYAKNQLGIDFDWIPTPGNYENIDSFTSKVKGDVENNHEYDIFAAYSMTGAVLTTKGYTENLLDEKYSKYLDFTKPWWPQKLIESASIKNKLYFCSGDISTNMLQMMYAIVFNKNLAEDYVTEDLYELVESKKWTLEKMFELCAPLKVEGGYNDSNYDLKYGMACGKIHIDMFFTGSGIDTIQKDKDGHLTIADSWNNEKTSNLVNKLRNFFNVSGGGFIISTGNYLDAFKNGQVLFTPNRVQILGKSPLVDIKDIKFGLLPAPLYDEKQENYLTCMGFPFTVYAISTTSPNKVESAATISALGLAGKKEVTPALFEVAMKLKYSDEAQDSKMFDIIHDTVYIEVGRIFSKTLNGAVYLMFRDSLTTKISQAYKTIFTFNKKTINNAIDTVNKAIDELK